MNSPLGTDPENGNALSCWPAAIYSESSSAPPELHGESPGTLRICPAALATGLEKGIIRKETKFIWVVFCFIVLNKLLCKNNPLMVKKRKIKK